MLAGAVIPRLPADEAPVPTQTAAVVVDEIDEHVQVVDLAASLPRLLSDTRTLIACEWNTLVGAAVVTHLDTGAVSIPFRFAMDRTRRFQAYALDRTDAADLVGSGAGPEAIRGRGSASVGRCRFHGRGGRGPRAPTRFLVQPPDGPRAELRRAAWHAPPPRGINSAVAGGLHTIGA
jgi:hypothetical protein